MSQKPSACVYQNTRHFPLDYVLQKESLLKQNFIIPTPIPKKKKKWTLSLQPNGKFLIHFLTLLEMKVLSVFRGEDCYWMLMSSGCF